MIVEPEFERALARASIRAIDKAQRHDPLRAGDTSAVMYGPLIDEIADEADMSVPQTRRRLQALQQAGKVIRDDRRGGSTAWWPVGLAETQRQPVTPPPAASVSAPALTPRQTLTPRRQHWSDVLGVPRNCSTSEARPAIRAALEGLDPTHPDYPAQRQLVHDAVDACCLEHHIQITE
ncbi:MAG: hypothetical protein GAK28_03185 [Luteibacter sp.]|uniref:FaeA/PapI family transcriptional regulator n=1 Tax=Luteibacter sp. TaxID=1886636 RepID=UPI00138281DD|nr:FaeA/PapI family transcriptional regulator [Luteibacter sp.]KAF1005433.1 MAG: hypothetical protein GAK28_03185 [Luteibacter sp.]